MARSLQQHTERGSRLDRKNLMSSLSYNLDLCSHQPPTKIKTKVIEPFGERRNSNRIIKKKQQQQQQQQHSHRLTTTHIHTHTHTNEQ